MPDQAYGALLNLIRSTMAGWAWSSLAEPGGPAGHEAAAAGAGVALTSVVLKAETALRPGILRRPTVEQAAVEAAATDTMAGLAGPDSRGFGI
jgi:hypothetical protein